MTLFRKVFQTQSKPATAQDRLDEEVLRQAFADRKNEPSLLGLDSFDPKQPEAFSDRDFDDADHDDAERVAHDLMEDEDWEDESEDEKDDVDALYEEYDDAPDVYETDEMSELDSPGVIDDTPETAEGDAVQSDEEIAACLGRALAAEAPSQAGNAAAFPTAGDPETGGAEPDAMSDADHNDEDFETEESSAEPDVEMTRFAEEPMVARRASAPTEETEETADPELDLSPLTGLGAVPEPAVGRAGRRAGRVKTRLLGFNRGGDLDQDPFGQTQETTATAQSEKFPVGWLVIVDGPGVGHAFSIFTGASMIGRGEDQVIRLDFGDNSISRHNHAAIAYDEEQNKFYIGHGGKSNIIRRNARPVLSTEELHHADLIRIGETTLRFVALCGSDFQWNTGGGAYASGA